jgi:hypothetical protein
MQYATDDWGDICAAYADTNGDGYIDHLDLSAILYNWNNVAEYSFSNEPDVCYDIDDPGNFVFDVEFSPDNFDII